MAISRRCILMHRRGGCSFFLDGDLARRVIAEVELELCLRTVFACVDDNGLKKLGQDSVSPRLRMLDSIFALTVLREKNGRPGQSTFENGDRPHDRCMRRALNRCSARVREELRMPSKPTQLPSFARDQCPETELKLRLQHSSKPR